MTPLQHQPGIITPNGLVFERHHAGASDIDPKTHRLVIHGMVKQPLQFTMDDMRYPSVSRFHPWPALRHPLDRRARRRLGPTPGRFRWKSCSTTLRSHTR